MAVLAIRSPLVPVQSTPVVLEYDKQSPVDEMEIDEPSFDDKVLAQVDLNNIEKPRGHKVTFHYNDNVESHHFGRHHPMKPWRLTLTKQLILSYGLQYAMDCHQTRAATKEELALFHKDDYLDFLQSIRPKDVLTRAEKLRQYNFGEDCPVFDGLWDYCTLYSGATIDATRKLMNHEADIAINWSGGLHHAKKSEASGFCYVNDIVIAIIDLLREHPRVLYIDIDVHHGDGVEQAFASTDRVMTLSYHKYDKDNFFPGTGALDHTGPENPNNPGAHHSLNVPLRDGIDDDEYIDLFDTITGATIETFRPTAIVLQCGADSLGGDRLGRFNLNITAHGHCVEFIKKQGLPLLVIGGGGYTARNVARVWCHETSICVDAQLSNDLPPHIPYMQAFTGVEHGSMQLYPNLSNLEVRHPNQHDKAYLENIKVKIFEQLRYLQGAPSVQMQWIPPDLMGLREELDEELKEEREQEEVVRRKKERNIGGRGEHRFL
ncbi:MAG: histone deacetylase [Bogoriella megaspora]|nr:MAG: histone deacetylase [Bogoriella megaspora]